MTSDRPTDFTASAARVSEGFCPLCGCQVVLVDDDGYRRGTCTKCNVGWQVTAIEGRPALTTSRRLTAEEIRFLYARS